MTQKAANKTGDQHPAFSLLEDIRSWVGRPLTTGLSDDMVLKFLHSNKDLEKAIQIAHETFNGLDEFYKELLKKDEQEVIQISQKGFVNFYDKNAINPYVGLNGYGAWIVTAYGGVLHDNGGYGMLGGGHNPEAILDVLGKPTLMANIMTPNLWQLKLESTLNHEIGSTRSSRDGLYEKYICLNSGSESVTIATRLTDINAKEQLAAQPNFQAKTPKFIALKGGFHGRTDRPAQISDSSLPKYKQYMHSFSGRENLVTVEPNDCAELEKKFKETINAGHFVEAIFMEPVMGEGNPGMGITREFYDLARKLTKDHNSMLVIDSIQASIRTWGCVSIVDYPGFRDAECPDMETFSKALNGGQYPLSILAMSERAASRYHTGVYGNTMTTNPKALEVAYTVLSSLTPDLKKNIVAMGELFIEKFSELKSKYPDCITKVQGTGLLFSVELDSKKFKIVAENGVEKWLRINGINVIHGGVNSLRFTPPFAITAEEVELIVTMVEKAILAFNK